MRRLKTPWQGCKGLKAKVSKITFLLEKKYGIPQREPPRNPVDILIETILSQNTSDTNRNRAYRNLRGRFPRWEDVLKAKRRSVVSAIRAGGLAEQKARCIHSILRWIKKREGRISLAFLKRMSYKEIEETIGSLKGIGPKTLHCLLLFGLGREAFPIDTHILRLGKRLGFFSERMGAERAHTWIVPFLPNGRSLSLHLNLIRFGRSVCKARRPCCSICFLKNACTAVARVRSTPSP